MMVYVRKNVIMLNVNLMEEIVVLNIARQDWEILFVIKLVFL